MDKSKRLFLIPFILLAITFNAKSTNLDLPNKTLFEVIATQGICLVERVEEKENWKPLSSGSELFAGDKIIVTEGSYLGLFHFTGKGLELKNAGVFRISELNEKMKDVDGGDKGQYLQYIVKDLLGSGPNEYFIAKQDPTKRKKRDFNRLKYINLAFPERTKMLAEPVHISWEQDIYAGDYTIEVLNLFDEVIWSHSTNDTCTLIDLASLELESEQFYQIQVYLEEKPEVRSAKRSFYLTSADQTERFQTQLQDIKKELSFNSPLDHLILSSFYEDKGYYFNAYKKRFDALKLLPQSKEMRRSKEAFEERHLIY